MASTNIEMIGAGSYDYCKVPKTLVWDDESLYAVQEKLQQSHGQGKKVVLGLHPSLHIEAHQCPLFLQFLQEEMQNQLVIAPQKQKLEWGNGWKELLRQGLPLAELSKAMEMASGSKMTPRHQCLALGSTLYVKSAGDVFQQPATWNNLVRKAVTEATLPGKFLSEPLLSELPSSITWNQLQGGLIFDLAETMRLEQKLLDALRHALQQRDVKINAPGIYFVTSSVFQRWLLAQFLQIEEIPEYGNILRIVTSRSLGDIEGPLIVKAGQQKVPPLNFLLHYATPEQAESAAQQFYAELTVADEWSVAQALQKKAPAGSRKHISYLMPATDSKVKILGPEIMMKGCEARLFADFLITRYQNNHGYPNDTYVYCLDGDTQSVHKVTDLLRTDFPCLLQQFQGDLFTQLLQCQLATDKQGYFLFSLLKEDVVNFEISLPLTVAGNAQFLLQYGKLFSGHYCLLNDVLRIFIKNSFVSPDIDLHLQFVQGINKITVRQQGFLLEAKWQEQEFWLTVQAGADKEQGARCMALFTLLNGSQIFNRLPEKELFIELISLLWENFQGEATSQQGFLITLRVSPQATELKVFQNQKNKASLREMSEGDCQHMHLLCDTLYSLQAQKRLLKLLTMFFYAEPQQTAENAWKFACIEGLSQAAMKLMSNHVLNVEFKNEGEYKRAVLSSNAQQLHDIPARSRQTMESGADHVLIEDGGRKITLLKNPSPEELQKLQPPGELALPDDEVVLAETPASLSESQVIPSNLENVQAREIKVERTQLLAIYKQALNKHEAKSAANEETTVRRTVDATEETVIRKPAHLTSIRTSKYEKDLTVKKIYRKVAIGITVATVLLAAFLGYAFTARIPVAADSRKRVAPHAQTEGDKPSKPRTQPKIQYTGQTKQGIAFLQKAVSMFSLQAQQPSHNMFNTMLKRIYKEGKEFLQTPVAADIYNLQGRFYFYKIYFDQEDTLFDKNWKAAWQQEAIQAFTKAKQGYAENNNKPFFSLPVLYWMPEHLYHNQAVFVQYKTAQDGVKDMEKWLERVQNIKF
jgi:hypothetical protein